MTVPTDRDLPAAGSDASLGEMLAAASRDMSALVRGEIELAKAELRVDAKYGAKAVGLFGGAVFVVLLAVILVSFAIAYAFDTFLPTWLAFLLTGVLFVLIAVVLAFVGRRAIKSVKMPERTIKTAKDTADFLKDPRATPTGDGRG
jgi:uncharacterized membrane protein YqjE